MPYIPNTGIGVVSYVDMGAYEAQTIWYVKSDGEGNGFSWDFALSDPNQAIIKSQPGDEIWVAKGTYQVVSELGATTRQGDTYLIDKPISLYGGFNGDESLRSQRDWVNNETVFSGEIIGDASDPCDDDCRHVMVITDDGAIIDGFSFINACAQDVGTNEIGGYQIDNRKGGGIYCVADTTIRNCVFHDVRAYLDGACIYNYDNNVVIDNCFFHSNSCRYQEVGNCIYNEEAVMLLSNSNFSRNYGSAIYNYDSEINIINCVFRENYGRISLWSRGGAVYNDDSTCHIINSLFASNFTTEDGGGNI